MSGPAGRAGRGRRPRAGRTGSSCSRGVGVRRRPCARVPRPCGWRRGGPSGEETRRHYDRRAYTGVRTDGGGLPRGSGSKGPNLRRGRLRAERLRSPEGSEASRFRNAPSPSGSRPHQRETSCAGRRATGQPPKLRHVRWPGVPRLPHARLWLAPGIRGVRPRAV